MTGGVIEHRRCLISCGGQQSTHHRSKMFPMAKRRRCEWLLVKRFEPKTNRNEMMPQT